MLIFTTLFESENERQKIEPVPIPLPRASRNFPDVKTRNDFFFYNWTLEIIPFIRLSKQTNRTKRYTFSFKACSYFFFKLLEDIGFSTRNSSNIKIQALLQWLTNINLDCMYAKVDDSGIFKYSYVISLGIPIGNPLSRSYLVWAFKN